MALYKTKSKNWMQKAFSKNAGGLHRVLGVPENEEIPVDKMLAALKSKNDHIRRMAQAAVNANPGKYHR